MPGRLPDPTCNAFLVCGRADTTPDGETVLVALPTALALPEFPAEVALGFFARLTSARGEYSVDVLLEDDEGELVWSDGPAACFRMDDPLWDYDFRLNMNVPFPRPADYQFVLRTEGREVARQRFKVVLRRSADGGPTTTEDSSDSGSFGPGS